MDRQLLSFYLEIIDLSFTHNLDILNNLKLSEKLIERSLLFLWLFILFLLFLTDDKNSIKFDFLILRNTIKITIKNPKLIKIKIESIPFDLVSSSQ